MHPPRPRVSDQNISNELFEPRWRVRTDINRFYESVQIDRNRRRAGPTGAHAAVSGFVSCGAAQYHPKALQNLTNRIRRERDGTRNFVRDFLRIAAQESRLDYYPYETAINEIRKAATESYKARVAEGDSGAIFDEFDFGRLSRTPSNRRA